MSDIEAARRQQGFATGVGSLTSMASGSVNSFINPKAQNTGNASADPNAQSFRESLNEGANTAIRQDMKNLKLEKVPDSPEFDFGNIYQNMGLNSTRNPDKYAYSQPLSIGNPSYED